MGAEQGWGTGFTVRILAARRGGTFPLVHFWTLAVEEHSIWSGLSSCERSAARVMAVSAVVALAGIGVQGVGPGSPSNEAAVYMLTPSGSTHSWPAPAGAGGAWPEGLRGCETARVGAVLVSGATLVAGRVWDAGPFTPWVQTVGYSIVALFCTGLIGLALPSERQNLVARGFGSGWLRARQIQLWDLRLPRFRHGFVTGRCPLRDWPSVRVRRRGLSGLPARRSRVLVRGRLVELVGTGGRTLTLKDRFFRYR